MKYEKRKICKHSRYKTKVEDFEVGSYGWLLSKTFSKD